MPKIGMVQTVNYSTNEIGISKVANILQKLGKKETEIVCLPEQWLKNNIISDFDSEFAQFKKIAKDYGMTIIPGAFYTKNVTHIISPVIGPKGDIIGHQKKIHPFDYEIDTVKPGKEAKIFKTACKFGIIICYDMVFPKVANALAKKGAQILLSPSRIVRRGIEPWHMYVQVRALENRIPILAANVENRRFGGQSIMIDLSEKNKVVNTKVTKLKGENQIVKDFNLDKLVKSRKKRFSDSNNFK
ncbi:carbon-nitrogen hydrolase family protein [Nitrosopumilus sp.]|uniref:carbon-nitrogen hydrolase family protein n=1 Tax=Nitrosopumilus sp. TaxID=2024843 RepID=UPI002622FAEC|nr:carbon-nitrogen hydrolase family protein [Nitrosopumilus sp.]